MNTSYDRSQVGMDLLRSLYEPRPIDTVQAEDTSVNVEAVNRAYGEKEMVLKHARYGKILGLVGSSDYVGAQPYSFYNDDPSDWKGASRIPINQLTSMFSADYHTLLDNNELFNAPITFSPVITGAYRFNIGAHYPISENLLSYFHGTSQNSAMRRTTYNCEQFNIGGKIGDPYPHTGYDVFDRIKHPFFWTRSPDEIANMVINPRFPVSQFNSDKDAIITEDIVVNETWGFPETYADAKEYFPLVAKILSTIHDKPYDWDQVIAITSGFDKSTSMYENAVKKLDFVRFLHDLHGKWIMFGTSPDVGKDLTILGITFADPEYFQKGAEWSGDKPLIKMDVNNLTLTQSEIKIVELLEQKFSNGDIEGSPAELYTKLQSEIVNIL